MLAPPADFGVLVAHRISVQRLSNVWQTCSLQNISLEQACCVGCAAKAGDVVKTHFDIVWLK